MKTYTFKESTKKNFINSSIDNMNALFTKKIKEFAPYLNSSNNNTPKSINIIYKETPEITKTIDFIEANNILFNYFKFKTFSEKSIYDDYDFELKDGTPVKIFDDEIQIGYDLIPIKYFANPKLYLFGLEPKKKKLIIDIAIKLKK